MNVSQQKKNPLGYEKLPKLLAGYAIPSIIAMLVSSLYNIVAVSYTHLDVYKRQGQGNTDCSAGDWKGQRDADQGRN